MNINILKRIGELERATTRVEIPSLIIMSYDEQNDAWDVLERYTRHDGKGNIIRGGHERRLEIKDFNDYAPPRGFTGTIIIDNI